MEDMSLERRYLKCDECEEYALLQPGQHYRSDCFIVVRKKVEEDQELLGLGGLLT